MRFTFAEVVFNVSATNNLWANYRIARAAVRYGHHKIALHIFSSLTESVSSEHLHFWLECLKEMCEGESKLINEENANINLVDRIDVAILHYNKAIAALKVCKTNSFRFNNVTGAFYYFRPRAPRRTTFNSKRNTCESERNFSKI